MLQLTALAVGAMTIALSPIVIRLTARHPQKDTEIALSKLARTLVVTQAFLGIVK